MQKQQNKKLNKKCNKKDKMSQIWQNICGIILKHPVITTGLCGGEVVGCLQDSYEVLVRGGVAEIRVDVGKSVKFRAL